MKAIIDEDGFIDIERAGKMKAQLCFNQRMHCGDWCPAFREPYMNNRGDNFPGSYRLRLCHQVGELFFDEIDDQRIRHDVGDK